MTYRALHDNVLRVPGQSIERIYQRRRMTSPHLESIIAHRHGSAHLQVVFVDIVGYAKRKRATQFAVIKDFTRLVNASLEHLDRTHTEYCAAHGTDFHRDVIKVATGFGLAVVFTFDALPSAPADFARRLAEAAQQHNRQVNCRQFDKAQWCNCHRVHSSLVIPWYSHHC